MPTYDFICSAGHVREARRGYDEEVIACPEPACFELAVRVPINENQYVVTETGARDHRKAPVPRDERYMRNEYQLYREASAEIDDKYSKAEESIGRPLNPRLYEHGLQRARDLKAKGVTAEEFRKRKTS